LQNRSRRRNEAGVENVASAGTVEQRADELQQAL